MLSILFVLDVQKGHHLTFAFYVEVSVKQLTRLHMYWTVEQLSIFLHSCFSCIQNTLSGWEKWCLMVQNNRLHAFQCNATLEYLCIIMTIGVFHNIPKIEYMHNDYKSVFDYAASLRQDADFSGQTITMHISLHFWQNFNWKKDMKIAEL